MYNTVGLIFDDRKLANRSELVKILINEAQEETSEDIVQKVSSLDLDYRFEELQLTWLLEDKKKIGIYIGTDTEGLAHVCAEKDHDKGYAIVLPGENGNYFYIEPILRGETIVYMLYNLSQNGSVRIKAGQSEKPIPKEGHELKPNDVILFRDKKVQFKYKVPAQEDLDSTVIMKPE